MMTRGQQQVAARWLRAYANKRHRELSKMLELEDTSPFAIVTDVMIEIAACAKAAEILEECAGNTDG